MATKKQVEEAKAVKLKKFKALLKASISDFNPDENRLFDQIPESLFGQILRDNFNNDLTLARKILFNDIKNISYDDIEKEIDQIHNLEKSVKLIDKYLKSGKPIVCITDNDNDGSIAQTALIEFKRLMPDETKNLHILYAQNIDPDKQVHGFTYELVEKWAETERYTKSDDFLVVTADNGIQSKEEAENVVNNYKKANLLITDHHLPDPEKTPRETSRLTIFDPKYKPTSYFRSSKNISGGHTLASLLRRVYMNNTELSPKEAKKELRTMNHICQVSNLLDFVETDIRLKPIDDYLAFKFNNLRALMNVNNSVSSLATRDIGMSKIDQICKKIPEFNKEDLTDAILEIQELNIKASKLLRIQHKLNDDFNETAQQLLTEELFHIDYIHTLQSEDENFSHFNTNYIEQLRPHIYFNELNPNKSSYEVSMLKSMVGVFEQLKKAERKIVNQLKEADLMNVIQRDNVTIMYPKDFEVMSLFNKKLIMKAYNENNKGVYMLFGSYYKDRMVGSFRSLMDKEDIFMNDHLFKELELELKGHSKAAGAFLKAKNGEEINPDTIERYADFIQSQYKDLKQTEKYEEDFVLMDTTNFNIVKEINTKIKAHFGMIGSIKPLVKLDNSMYFEEKRTGKKISIFEMLKQNKYGYTTVALNFHDDVLIIPTEVVRNLKNNNFKDYIQFSYLSDGAFIAEKVIRKNQVNPKNLTKLESPIKESENELMSYYKEEFVDKNSYAKKLSREQVKGMPLFERNPYGDEEFDRVEETILQVIDNSDVDTYVVLDVEANGFGKPQLFNFGTLEITPKKDSGVTITSEEYRELLDDGKKMANFCNKKLNGEKVKNVKFNKGDQTITVNRELDYELFSTLCRDTDFKLLKNITALTNISQSSLNKYGMKTSDLDVMLNERYKGKRHIFAAHNSNYDFNVVSINCPEFYKTALEDNLILDTARFAKEQTLGFSDIHVTRLHPTIKDGLFFDHELADYSLTTMLESEKDFIYPDMRNEFLLKSKGDTLYLVDKKKNIETELPYDSKAILNSKTTTPMPLNRVKYSVTFLMDYDNIRSMLLTDIKHKIKIPEANEFIESVGIEDLYKEFCKGYNFDAAPQKNMMMFIEALSNSERKEDEQRFNNAIFGSYMMNQSDVDAAEKQNKEQDENNDPIANNPVNKFLENKEKIEKENAKIEKKKEKEIAKIEKKLTSGKISEDDFEEEVRELTEKLDKEKTPTANFDLFVDSVNEFLAENKELYLKYISVWEYKALLEVYDPDKPTMNKSEVQNVHYKTSLDKERIKEMAKEIYDFKKKMGIKGAFYIPELHNNIDERGDAAIEGLLVFNRLNNKYYNRYDKSINLAASIVQQSTIETTYQAIRKYYLEQVLDRMNVNSSTFKQLTEQYKNRRTSDGKEHYSDLIKKAKSASRIQLQSKLLGQGNHIIGSKNYQDVGKDVIEDIKDDLDFIMGYSLMETSEVKSVNIGKILESYAKKKKITEHYDLYKSLKENFGMFDNEEENADLPEFEEIEKYAKELFDDIKDDQLKNIEVFYQIEKKFDDLNNNFANEYYDTLSELDEEFVHRYKDVYNKIGYFRITKEESEIKDVVDSIMDSLFTGDPEILKDNTKFLREEHVEAISQMTGEILNKLEPLIKLVNKESNIPLVKESIMDLLDNRLQVVDDKLKEYESTVDTVLKNFENQTQINKLMFDSNKESSETFIRIATEKLSNSDLKEDQELYDRIKQESSESVIIKEETGEVDDELTKENTINSRKNIIEALQDRFDKEEIKHFSNIFKKRILVDAMQGKEVRKMKIAKEFVNNYSHLQRLIIGNSERAKTSLRESVEKQKNKEKKQLKLPKVS